MVIREYVSPLIDRANEIFNAGPGGRVRETSHWFGQGLLWVAGEGRHLTVVQIIAPRPTITCVALTRRQYDIF